MYYKYVYMNIFFHFVIFCLVVFFYLHMKAQYKVSEDLEIYELDYTDNQHLQEICDAKQPILFLYKEQVPELFEAINSHSPLLTGENPYDLKVKDSTEYMSLDETINSDVENVFVPGATAITLMNTDTSSKYYSENNHSFIEENGLIPLFRANDEYLKPHFGLQTKYDIIVGSKKTSTPLQYHTAYRKYLCVNSGNIRIKMTPWSNMKYMNVIKNYDTLEFYTNMNAWKPQDCFRKNYDKIKFLEFNVKEGHILYIPSYWWYSIQFTDGLDSVVTGFSYSTIMNSCAHLPDTCLHFIQQLNTKQKLTKTLDTKQFEVAAEEPTIASDEEQNDETTE